MAHKSLLPTRVSTLPVTADIGDYVEVPIPGDSKYLHLYRFSAEHTWDRLPGKVGFYDQDSLKRAARAAAELVVDGVITADKIAANSITASKISVSTLTVADIANLAPKSMGIPTADKLPVRGEMGLHVFLKTDNKLYRHDGTTWRVATPTAEIR